MKILQRAYGFFKENEQSIIASDWHRLKYMTGLYMLCQVIYILTVCLYEKNPDQTAVLSVFLLIQAVYSLLVWTRKSAPKNRRGLDLYLVVFAANIMLLSIVHGDFVFRENNAWMFPIMLIMVTQIYSVPPEIMLVSLPGWTVVFLVFSFLNKSTHFFFIDSIAAVTSLMVASICYMTLLEYKIEKAEYSRELIRMCSVDAMTGVYNKNSFIHMYNRLRRENPQGGKTALAILDIDNFKQINDRHGHMAGDEVLRGFSSLLREVMSDGDRNLVGRYGGDEFVVYFKNPGNIDTVKKATESFVCLLPEKMKEQVGFLVTCSVGVAFSTENRDSSFAALFLNADRELYRIKGDGGNAVGVAEKADAKKQEELLLIINGKDGMEEAAIKELRGRYRMLEAEGAQDSINMLERYGESLTLVIINCAEGEKIPDSIFSEIKKYHKISRFPVVVLREAEDDKTEERIPGVICLIKPLRAGELKEEINS